MEINLSGEKTITIVPAQNVVTNVINIERMVDLPNERTVFAMTRELGRIELWVGDAYDAIGQWTDDDVQNRIIELYNS